VTLYSIDKSASAVPLFMLKADSPTFHAICFRKSPAQQLMSFSLAICRTLGYDALQRYGTFLNAMNIKGCNAMKYFYVPYYILFYIESTLLTHSSWTVCTTVKDCY
jgi:hypothetical protein